mgnify:FL=1
MAKRTQQLNLPSEIAEIAQSAAPVAVVAPEVTPDQIAQLILKGSDDTKAAIRKALDLDKTHARVRKNKNQTNSQVRNTVKAIGEVTHIDGYVPDPPGRISDRGPEAIRIWQERWLDSNGDNLSEYDLDHMSLEAHE